MAQLGSGNGSGYSQAIDTRQTWQNGTPALPDSASRLDAEGFNDFADALVKIETALGTNPQGVYGSLAARLQQFLPGGGTTPLLFHFTNQTTYSVPGQQHRLGSALLLHQVYSNDIPQAALFPETFTIDQTTFDVTVSFATAQTGALTLASAPPLYTTTFTNQTSVTILGATHQLGTALLLIAVFSGSGVQQVWQDVPVTVDPTSFDVVITFATPESGSILLSAAGPRYSTSFTNTTTVSVGGGTHGLGSKALLYAVYDNSAPRQRIWPNSFTVHPSTFAVEMTFVSPQSGTLLLVKASEIPGTEFTIQDGGIADSTAVRVFSEDGMLNLQMGNGDATHLKSKDGAAKVTLTNTGNLGIGTTMPSFRLQLALDSAAKPGTNTWTIASDARLKDVLRPFTDGLALLLSLPEAVWYRYNGLGGIPRDEQDHVGFLAQAVQAIAPYMVSTRRGRLAAESPETDLLSFNAHALTFILINAVKELTGRVAHLEAVVQHLTEGTEP